MKKRKCWSTIFSKSLAFLFFDIFNIVAWCALSQTSHQNRKVFAWWISWSGEQEYGRDFVKMLSRGSINMRVISTWWGIFLGQQNDQWMISLLQCQVNNIYSLKCQVDAYSRVFSSTISSYKFYQDLARVVKSCMINTLKTQWRYLMTPTRSFKYG